MLRCLNRLFVLFCFVLVCFGFVRLIGNFNTSCGKRLGVVSSGCLFCCSERFCLLRLGFLHHALRCQYERHKYEFLVVDSAHANAGLVLVRLKQARQLATKRARTVWTIRVGTSRSVLWFLFSLCSISISCGFASLLL